ncbi:MAG TPA: efflux RND transporter permease subunit [Candidatus Saccharimonadia bacterium]|nr:efflux RND transporter permease subunit [Candidatus Saccharimonadia bacterium]
MTQPSTNWVSRTTAFFLHRRQIVIILLLGLVFGGLTALTSLRREGFPRVPVKIVVVSTVYKGAAAGEIEQTVTNPVEAAIKDVREVKSIASNSGESHSSVVATLNENANLDAALQNITSKVAGITLPPDADKPTVSQPTTGSSSFVFGLSGPASYEELLAAGRIFKREIEQVKGVKQVELASSVTDRVNVVFDPTKLTAAGVDTAHIATAVAAGNLNLPAGSSLTLDGARATALTAGRDRSLADLGATPLPTLSGGTVTLASVAAIDRVAHVNGSTNRIGIVEDGLPVAKPGLVYNVDISSDADILTVDTTLSDTLKRLADNHTLSSGIHITRLIDDAANTTDQINEIKAGAIGQSWSGIGPLGFAGYLVGGIWLLMLAMFLFVNLRIALIAGVAIPLSFFFTLMALYFGGITLNTLTLFSMILVLGLVVDPAIVVLESIQRYKDLGYTGKDGVLAAMGSIGQGLVLATLCSIIVFTPFGIVSGVFGEIIKFIPITVIPALIASFFVPLIFLAPFATRFIKPHRHAGKLGDEQAALWATSRWFKRANLYILGRVWLQIIIMIVAVVAPLATTGYLFASGKVKSAQFSKPHDTTEAMASIAYPASFTPTQVDQLARQTEQALAKHFEIASYYYLDQLRNTSGGSGSNSFTVYITLTPIKDRTITSEQMVSQLKADLPHDTAKQIYASASTLSAGPPENTYPVQLQIYEADLARLKDFTIAAGNHVRATAGVTRVSDGYTDGSVNAVQINVNKAKAAARGLNPATIGAQVSGLLGEQTLTKLALDDITLDVVSSYQDVGKYTATSDLSKITITSPTGPVQLSQIANLSNDAASGSINHQDGLRYATVRAQVDSSTTANKVQSELNDWAKSHLAAAGLSSSALENKGEDNDIAQSFLNLFAALGVAIVMIYLLLAIFFGSFLKPLIITFALPLSFLGVFPVLAILGNEFGFLEILGLITLAGIVVNVGIFVIDAANHRVAAGMPVKEAIAEATAVRFRPIFLTKITALGSLLPLAILSPFWRGLASVIIAGILTSGILSLFTTPILYVWFTKLSKLPAWIARRSRRGTQTPPATSASGARPESPPTLPAVDPSA